MSFFLGAPKPPVLPGADRRPGPFPMRLLAREDVGAVIALRDEVLGQLDNPDLYVRERDEGAFVRSHIAGHDECAGDTIGVFDGDELIAYAMLGLPAQADANLGRHVDLGSRTLGDVAHLASCMVRGPYRGHGLQRTMLSARFSLAHAYGREVCIAMVSLHNHASRRNLLRTGLRIVYTGVVEGLNRQLAAIDLARAWKYEPGQARLVDSGDFAGQVELTRSGWWGVSEIESAGPGVLVFARPARQAFHGTPL
ncbi:MAG: hypothetical protein ABIR26_13630 [Ramlibacter sp.]